MRTSLTDEQVADLQLSGARAELLEDIMATPETDHLGARRARSALRSRVVRATAAASLVAAAVGGALVISHDPAPVPAPSAGPIAAPPTAAPEFTTVGQLVDTAAGRSRSVDPTDAPYWKIASRETCQEGSKPPCTTTLWSGIDRPGVTKHSGEEAWAICPATVAVNGVSLPWSQVNDRRWTAKDVASMVADGGSDKPGRASSDYYVFKNTTELLLMSPASRTIRRQLWDGIKHLPNVTLDGRKKDALGRTGWRLTYREDVEGPYGQGAVSQSVLVDTATGALLERTFRAADEDPYTSTILSAGPADRAPRADGPAEDCL